MTEEEFSVWLRSFLEVCEEILDEAEIKEIIKRAKNINHGT